MSFEAMGTQGVNGQEYWVRKGDVDLFLWRKRTADAAGAPRLLPVLLVHGSSLSALPTFDLTVPTQPDYSFMDWLASKGCDVWTLDHEGYGRSGKSSGNSDISSGADDIKAATDLIFRETSATALNIYGLSSGALRASVFAQHFPSRVNRLALDGFVWTGEGSITLANRKQNVEYFRKNNSRSIDRDFIASIFNRDMPGTSSVEVIEACARAQLTYTNSVPTGTYLDMTTKLPLVEPEQLTMPTLVVRGEHDGIATLDDLAAFFIRLPSSDKQLSVLPNLAHCTPLGVSRKRLWRTVMTFFDVKGQ